mgnify:CR=1 FL=1
MFESAFKKPIRPVKSNESCKIKIKNTKGGRTISFEGNCSKEQLQMAQMGLNDGSAKIEDDD